VCSSIKASGLATGSEGKATLAHVDDIAMKSFNFCEEWVPIKKYAQKWHDLSRKRM